MSKHNSARATTSRPPWVRINLNDTPDQKDQPMREEDMVTAEDLVFTADEISQFRTKSAMRCPTFGACPSCWSAGPVGDQCRECPAASRGPDNTYSVLKVLSPTQIKWVDARAFARLMDFPVAPIAADAQARWFRQPEISLSRATFDTLVARKYEHVKRKLFV